MRTLDSALSTAFGYTVQRPAWLVQIAWDATTWRWSSYDNVTWASNSWTKNHIDLSRLKFDDLDPKGSMILGNADDAVAAQLLTDGIAGRQIDIYGYDAGAVSGGSLGADVPVHLISGVGGKASISAELITIDVRSLHELSTTPRDRVSAPTFTYLIAAGTRLTINGQTYVLDRAN